MAQQVASLYADIGAKTQGFEKGAASVLGGLGKIAISVGTLTSALAIMEQAWDMSKEGAELQRLADSGAEVARQYGGNMDLIIQKVKEASHGTVSEMDIIASANKAMMLGLGADADQLANLMQIAAFRGRAMGLSTTQAFDDIVRGIGRASPMILDNLGIVVSANETYTNYAEKIGKSANELTKAEKTQALLNAVVESGNELLDEAGGLVEDNATQYEKLAARQKDYTDSLKRTLSQAVTPGIEAFLDYSEAMDKASEATGMNDQRSRMYLGAMQMELDKLAEQEQRLRDVTTARLEGLAALYSATSAEDNYVLTLEEQEEAIKNVSEANRDMLSTIGDMQRQSESYQKKYEDITSDMNLSDDERKAKLQELADEHEQYTRRVVLGLLEQKFMQDGILTDDELNWLLEKGEAWGIYSQTVIDEAKRAMDEANNLATALANMPKEGTFTFFMNTVGDVQGVVKASAAAPQFESRRASGGNVNAGESYLVGEQGMEIFTPNQNGMITPNSRTGSRMGTFGTGATINIVLDSATPDPDRVAYNLKPAVERVVRQLQQEGKLQ